jgi:PAS domain S-box-containing protein
MQTGSTPVGMNYIKRPSKFGGVKKGSRSMDSQSQKPNSTRATHRKRYQQILSVFSRHGFGSIPFQRRELPAIMRYGLPVLAVIISLAGTSLLQPFVFRTPLFFLSIIISTWAGGIGPGLLAVLLSTLAINLFLSPTGILETSFQNIPNVISFLIAALLVSSWSEARRRAEHAVRKARDELEDKVKERTASLSQSNQALQAEIVDRQQAEKALRESESKLKEAQQLAHIGYWEHDLITDRIICSEETRRIFGVKPEEAVLNQAKLLEMIHQNDRQKQRQALSEALKGNQLYDVEYRIAHPDGDIRFVHVRDEIEYNEAGRPIRMFGALQDITERKQAEEEIRRNAARAQLLANISQACDNAGLDYQRVLETITRHTAELIGDGSLILQLSDDRQRLRPAAFHHPNPKAFAVMQEILTNAPPGSLDTPISDRLLAGEALWMPAVTAEEIRPLLSPQYQPYIDLSGIASLLAVPLRVQGQVIGILSLWRDRPSQPYTHGDQVLLQDIADRAALTIENARLFQSVVQQRERLRELSARLVEAQETERRNLARELHDEVGQILSGLVMQLGIARSHLPKSAKTAQTILEGTEELIQEILGRMRAIIAGLRPQVLDDLGLVPAIRRLANEFQEDTGTQVEIKTDQIPNRLSAPLELALFRIVQEGLTNVRKHAQAHTVNIALAIEEGKVTLSIRDDGRGFENHPASPHSGGDRILESGWPISEGHFGLIGIQERAAQLGGRLQVTSALGQGTTVRVELPLADTQAGPDEPL